jgi:hypothetical protein
MSLGLVNLHMLYNSNTDEILKYAVEYLMEHYGVGDSISNRRNYINVIAHIISHYNLSYSVIDAHWPKFYLSDLIPQFKIAFHKWLSNSGVKELNQYTKILVEIIADRIIANIIYEMYLKQLSTNNK